MKNIMIEVRDLAKEFDDETVVNYINFTVSEGEFVTLLGPSGCGKTTILRMIAGFEVPTAGDIFLFGQRINDIPSYRRPVNTVFQNYALFPHMNVFENIAFPLRIKKLASSEIKEKVGHYMKVVALEGFDKRDVSSLSGGQQQRVAIARALANEPKVLLLDEPLSALDLKLRKEMQTELKRIQREVQITFIYVTHDQEEALSLSDKIIVMRKGEIQQIGSPIDIYNEPQNAYVADFIGESNIIDGVMDDNWEVRFLGKTFPCVDRRFPETNQVKVVIRPEDIDFTKEPDGMLEGTIESVVFKGVHYEYLAQVASQTFLIQSTEAKEAGESVWLRFDPDDIHIMRAEQRNILDATVLGSSSVEILGGVFTADASRFAAGTKLKAVVKPADWIVRTSGDSGVAAVVASTAYSSERYEFLARVGGSDVLVHAVDARKAGEAIRLDIDEDDIMLILNEDELSDLDAQDDEEGEV